MKLEVGMYVRTDDGEIGKITHIETETFSEPAYTLDIFTQGIYKGCKWFEGKASHNIIDLIEVGDYVNGLQVIEIGEYHSIKTDKVETYARVNCSALLNCFYEEDIKSIVTKEQFKSISYEVSK